MSDLLTWAASGFALFLLLTFLAWRRYLWASVPSERVDTCPYSLTDYFSPSDLLRVPHQDGIRWLSEVFSRSAKKYPNLPALQIPHTGESLTFAELDARVEKIAAALAPFLGGPDQVVAVAMLQDNAEIVASHLAILRAGGAMMFLDTTLPDTLVQHMLDDAEPVIVLTRGEKKFRDLLPTLDVLNLPEPAHARAFERALNRLEEFAARHPAQPVHPEDAAWLASASARDDSRLLAFLNTLDY